jgi:hypothetical protein
MYSKTRLPLSNAVVYTMERSRAPGCGAASELPDPAEDYGIPLLRTDCAAGAAYAQGTALEAGSVVIDRCLSRIFVAAYLLTGSAKQAETAVSESIQQLDINDTRGGWLSWKAVAAAIVREDPDARQTPEAAPVALPVELLRVLRLSPSLRPCFVLRVLMAMPRHYCASLLRIDAEQVDTDSCLAAQELAAIVVAEDDGLGVHCAEAHSS